MGMTRTVVAVTAALCVYRRTAAAQIPRAPDGKPDLSGFWQVMHTSAWLDIQDHSAGEGRSGRTGIVKATRSPTCRLRWREEAELRQPPCADPALK